MFYAICNLLIINIDWPQIIIVQSECMLSGLYLFLYQVIIITIFRPKLVWQWDICLYVSQSDLSVYNWDNLKMTSDTEFGFCCFLASNREWYKYILKFNIGEVLEIY